MDEKNGGVGLARKIGMDLALTLFDYNSENQNLLVCLDGDCTVESNYISTIRNYFNQNDILFVLFIDCLIIIPKFL